MSAVFPDFTGKACPKCGFIRPADATNPAWQCPRCSVAYNKAEAAARTALSGRAIAAHAAEDNSTWSLLAANVLAIAIAWGWQFSLGELMVVYWMQSVIIGLSYFLRMMSLQHFSTAGTTMNGRPIPETPAGKRSVALFFALHYGIFHTVYFFFLIAGRNAGDAFGTPVALAVCALAFLLNHAYSLAHNIEADRQGTPNLGTMMFLPYARIVPMHLTIILGGLTHGGAFAWWLFAVLKTLADVVMHVVEHRILRRGEPMPGGAVIGD